MLAGVAQLVERKTQDPKVAGSIPGGGIFYNVKLIKNLASFFKIGIRFFIRFFLFSEKIVCPFSVPIIQ